jgi:predicted  nucleic acid-binding Zn-ribbon protein
MFESARQILNRKKAEADRKAVEGRPPEKHFYAQPPAEAETIGRELRQLEEREANLGDQVNNIESNIVNLQAKLGVLSTMMNGNDLAEIDHQIASAETAIVEGGSLSGSDALDSAMALAGLREIKGLYVRRLAHLKETAEATQASVTVQTDALAKLQKEHEPIKNRITALIEKLQRD